MQVLRGRDLVLTSREILTHLEMYFGSAIHHVQGARNGLRNILDEHERGELKYKTFGELFDQGCPAFSGLLVKYLHEAGRAGAYYLNIE